MGRGAVKLLGRGAVKLLGSCPKLFPKTPIAFIGSNILRKRY